MKRIIKAFFDNEILSYLFFGAATTLVSILSRLVIYHISHQEILATILANLIGVKECTSLANMAYLIEHKPEEFLVYTGEDGDAFHAMNLGADGVISVASHTNGDEMHEMLTAIAESDMKKAAAIQRKFIPKVNALFSYPSPAPVKAVLNYMGFEAGPTRLPLVPAPEEDAKRIIKVVVDGDYEATKATVTGVLRPDY